MSTLIVVSQVGLWLIVALLLLAILALTRQVALIHRRIAPAGARMQPLGPGIGDRLPEFEGRDVAGRAVRVGTGLRKHVLMLFVSATCDTCAELMPAVRSVARSERRWLDVLLFDLAEQDERPTREFIERHQLEQLPWVSGRDFAQRCNVNGSPYAILADRDGRVEAKGLVNHLEHLESLLNASGMGHPSLENYVAAQLQERADTA